MLARRHDRAAATLRRHQTDVERPVWQALRSRQRGGAKFRRQAPLGPYIVDLLCLEARLIVELDGGHHGGEGDRARQSWLEQGGYRVLRFWNNDVIANLDGVLATIAAAIAEPSPSGRGLGEGGP